MYLLDTDTIITFVTNNTAHFKRIEGLKFANWTKDPEK